MKVLWLVMEALVAFVVGYAIATYGASYRFIVLFSLFALLLGYCFDPYISGYHLTDQLWLVVSNAIVVLYFVVGWLFYYDPGPKVLETSAKRGTG